MGMSLMYDGFHSRNLKPLEKFVLVVLGDMTSDEVRFFYGEFIDYICERTNMTPEQVKKAFECLLKKGYIVRGIFQDFDPGYFIVPIEQIEK